MQARFVVSSFIAVSLLGCAASPPATDQAAMKNVASAQRAAITTKPDLVEVTSAQFGVFGADHTGRRFLYETDHFPAIVAAPFGWFITFKTDKPTVIWREEFELPEAPPTWGIGEAMGAYQISPDRRIAVTERIIPTQVGFVGNEWRYAPGDPTGSHKIRVFIDGKLIREFAFAIEQGPAQKDEDSGDAVNGRRAI